MKKIILIVAMVLIAIGVNAQRPGKGTPLTPEERSDRLVVALAEKIQVSTAQQDSLRLIFTVFHKEQQTYREARNFEGMQSLLAQRDAKVQALLADEEKFKAYQAFMEERKGQFRKKGKNN